MLEGCAHRSTSVNRAWTMYRIVTNAHVPTNGHWMPGDRSRHTNSVSRVYTYRFWSNISSKCISLVRRIYCVCIPFLPNANSSWPWRHQFIPLHNAVQLFTRFVFPLHTPTNLWSVFVSLCILRPLTFYSPFIPLGNTSPSTLSRVFPLEYLT